MPTTKVKTKQKSEEKYYQAVGRRKTSTCTVRFYEKKNGEFTVNEKKLEDYFPTFDLQKKVKEPLQEVNLLDKFSISVKIKGGGVKSQSEAVRHGVARAIVSFDENTRKQLKTAGFLTRDPRMKESKKAGLKRARRAKQWRKR